MNENLEGKPELSSEEQRAQIVEQQQQELVRRRETGELAADSYDVNVIYYHQKSNTSVTRKDVGDQAIVINPDAFEALGYIEIIRADGETMIIDSTDKGFDKYPLIIFPEELGEEKSE